MHTHRRRPHVTNLQLPSSLASHHILRFAWCCKLDGYLQLPTQLLICKNCHYYLPDDYYNPLHYEHVTSHFVADGTRSFHAKCLNCLKSIVIKQPLNRCDWCTRTHLAVLTTLLDNNENLESQGNPMIIVHDGQDLEYTE